MNGAHGEIVGFKWSDGADHQAQPGILPAAVRDSEAVEIRPISAKFFAQQAVTLQRTQLPLVPCWAATIHKVQGLSLSLSLLCF